MQRSLKDYLPIVLKGMGMGAADVVPGVSGGTIAFITGIYEEFIGTLEKLNIGALRVLFKEGFAAFWTKINGSFLLALGSGIIISVAGLVNLISYLLKNQPELLWSFFFGLIVASIFYVGRTVTEWNIKSTTAFVIGTVFILFISNLPPISPDPVWWFIFLSGAIAICAMILPGISGSFLLLILGAYEHVITAVKSLELSTIAFFGAGCISGLLLFSRALKYAFDNFKTITIATLTGFLLGSLWKIWPWKSTTEVRIKHKGDIDEIAVPFIQENVLPTSYYNLNEVELTQLMLTDKDPKIFGCIALMLVGAGIIFLMEFIANKLSKK